MRAGLLRGCLAAMGQFPNSRQYVRNYKTGPNRGLIQNIGPLFHYYRQPRTEASLSPPSLFNRGHPSAKPDTQFGFPHLRDSVSNFVLIKLRLRHFGS